MATELEIINSALTKLGAGLITSDQKTNGSTKEARLAVERLPHVLRNIIRSHLWNFAIKRADTVSLVASGDPVANIGSNRVIGLKSPLSSGLPSGLQLQFKTSFANTALVTLNADAPAGATSFTGDVANFVIGANHFCNSWTTGGDSTANLAPEYEYSHSIPLPADFLRLLDVYDSDGAYRIEGSNLISNSSSPDILYLYDVSDYSKIDPSTIEAIAWGLAHDMSYAITQSQGSFQMTQQGYRQALASARTIDAQEDGRYYIEANLFDESRFGSSIFTDYRNHFRP